MWVDGGVVYGVGFWDGEEVFCVGVWVGYVVEELVCGIFVEEVEVDFV